MSSAKRDENQQVALILQNILGTGVIFPTGTTLTNATPAHVAVVDSNGDQVTSFGGSASGLDLPAYDYAIYTNVSATADRYVFKSGGSGGSTVATINIVYVDNTKDQISTVTKT